MLETAKSIDANDLAAIEGLGSVAQLVEQAEPAFDDGHITQHVPAWDYDAFDEFGNPSDAASSEPPPWPEPKIPGLLSTPDVPCSLLPGVWGEFAQAVSDSTQTPSALSTMTALAVLGTLLQGRYELDAGTHTEVLSFWTTTISAIGTRKTGVLQRFQEPLLHWEKMVSDRMRREIIRNEAIRSTTVKRIEHLRQQAAKASQEELESIRSEIEREELNMPEEIKPQSLFTEDITPETMQRHLSENFGRAAVLSDEPGLFRVLGGLYSPGGASLDVFLKGHVGSVLKVARSTRSIFVRKPCISMGLMVQPEMFTELAGSKNQFRHSGLMARFFYAVPITNVGTRDVRKRYRIPVDLVDAYDAAVMAMLADYPPPAGETLKPKVLKLDELAEDLWLDFSQEIEGKLIEGGPLDSIRDWLSKLAGATARVAALFEIATTGLDARTVGLESMHQAIKLSRLMIPHTQAAFGLLGANETEADAIHVLKWIRNQGVVDFKQRDAHHAMESRFKTVDKLKKAMDKLCSMDCVRLEQRKKGGGRPSTVFSVNPRVLS